MKKILNMFVVFMFMVATIPFVTAQEQTTVVDSVTTVDIEGQEYPTLERAMDRLRFSFARQEDRKAEVLSRIEQRREKHYNFLILKGKTEQAEKFRSGTLDLEKRFEAFKNKRAEKLATKELSRVKEREMESRIREKVSNKTRDRE